MSSTDDTGRDAGFLSGWSERKQAARQGVALPADPPRKGQDGRAEEAAAGATGAGAEAPLGAADPAPAPTLTDADMPPLDTLDGFSDYSGFLSRGISASLRRRALAQLFRSPHLNVTDGLDDFAEDYTRFEAMGELVTADMRHQLEVAAQRLAKRTADEADGAPGGLDAGVPTETPVTVSQGAEAPAALAESGPAVAALPDASADAQADPPAEQRVHVEQPGDPA